VDAIGVGVGIVVAIDAGVSGVGGVDGVGGCIGGAIKFDSGDGVEALNSW